VRTNYGADFNEGLSRDCSWVGLSLGFGGIRKLSFEYRERESEIKIEKVPERGV